MMKEGDNKKKPSSSKRPISRSLEVVLAVLSGEETLGRSGEWWEGGVLIVLCYKNSVYGVGKPLF
jgi:hypothetical protein